MESTYNIQYIQKLIDSNDQNQLTDILNKNKYLLNIKNNHGNNILHYSIAKGYHLIINLLLDEFKMDVNCQNRNGLRSLSIAIKENHEKCIKILLDNNCNILLPNSYKIYPIHIAAQFGKAEFILKYLLPRIEKSHLTITDNYGRTPLHYAAKFNKISVIDLLIKQNIEINTKDICGNTPLLLAVLSGNHNIIKYLLENNADLKTTNNFKYNIFHLLVEKNDINTMKYLLDNYDYNFLQDLIISRDHLGLTPLYNSKINNQTSIILSKYYLLNEKDISTSIYSANCICNMCKKLIYRPCKLICGHIYCRSCIFSKYYSILPITKHRCPECSKELVLYNDFKYDKYLDALIGKCKKEYHTRKMNIYENALEYLDDLEIELESKYILDCDGKLVLNINNEFIIIKYDNNVRKLIITGNLQLPELNNLKELSILEYLLNYPLRTKILDDIKYVMILENNIITFQMDINLDDKHLDNYLYKICKSLENIITKMKNEINKILIHQKFHLN